MRDIPDGGAPLYTADAVRALDRAAIERHGIPGHVLMARAGRAAFGLMRACWPAARRVAVVCGTGNNGGDGCVVARLARDHGLEVRLLVVGERSRIRGDALRALEAAIAAGLTVEPFDPAALADCDVVVDGLLGTGLTGPVRTGQAGVIDGINASGVPVLALDVPSGLCSDSGVVCGVAVRARHTLSFIGRKRGLYTGAGPDYCGSRHFDDLGVPVEVFDAAPASARLLGVAGTSAVLAPRARTAHKGAFGHVLVIGGNRGMAGAALLAAEAAARCGAGLVSAAVHPGNEASIVARRPEVMAQGTGFAHELDAMLARASVIVVGPGLGRGAWAQQMLTRALAARLPTVIDADALNALAAGEIDTTNADPARWILTPHPGEAARLLGCTSADVESDRFAALARLVERHAATVVLKGAGSLVNGPSAADVPAVCGLGNPGMGSGGMGDVLSGVLGALLAQGLPAETAARAGVLLHARAADLAAHEGGERGLLASDLMPWLRQLLNPVPPS